MLLLRSILGRWKIIAGAAVLGLAIFAGWKINGWRNDSTELDELRGRVEASRQALVAAQGRAELERAEATTLSANLQLVRRERDTALSELDSRPTLTRTVTEVLREDCPVCNCDALGADFRLFYNRAGSGPADPIEAATD